MKVPDDARRENDRNVVARCSGYPALMDRSHRWRQNTWAWLAAMGAGQRLITYATSTRFALTNHCH